METPGEVVDFWVGTLPWLYRPSNTNLFIFVLKWHAGWPIRLKTHGGWYKESAEASHRFQNWDYKLSSCLPIKRLRNSPMQIVLTLVRTTSKRVRHLCRAQIDTCDDSLLCGYGKWQSESRAQCTGWWDTVESERLGWTLDWEGPTSRTWWHNIVVITRAID
jgi:hypothetical protein